MHPSEYIVPAADGKNLGLLVVNDGQRGVYLDQDRGTEVVVVTGVTIARSIVEDYVLSQPAQDQMAGPGMFWVDGALTQEELSSKHGRKIAEAAKAQTEWWKRLVRLADDAWQTSHIIAQIGDLDRTACRQLGLKRDWLDDNPDSFLKCPVCMTLISVQAIVCFACKVVLKPEEYKQFQFAGQPQPVQTLNTKT